MDNFDRYLRIVDWAERRYSVNSRVSTVVGGKPSAYKRVEQLAYERILDDGPTHHWYLGVQHGTFRPMAGPFRTPQEADAVLEECRRIAAEIDPYTWVMDWQTARVRNYDKPGALNHFLQEAP